MVLDGRVCRPWLSRSARNRMLRVADGLIELGASCDHQIQCKFNEDMMLDIANDIRSLSDFKRNTVDLLDRIRKTGNPMVLTVNGKAELVVQDAEAATLVTLKRHSARTDG